jgi:hypothetical protein
VFASTIAEAVELGGHPPIDIDVDGLLRAFSDDESDEPGGVLGTDDDLLNAITALIDSEFADVSDERGGSRQADALVDLLLTPLLKSFSHRVVESRLLGVVRAVTRLAGPRSRRPETRTGREEFVGAAVNSDYALLRRLAIREQCGTDARVDWVATRSDTAVLMGTGLGPSCVSAATGARVLLLSGEGEIALGDDAVTVSTEYPDFRWTARLDAELLRGAAAEIAVRIEWYREGELLGEMPVGASAPVLGATVFALPGSVAWRVTSDVADTHVLQLDRPAKQ